MKDNNNIMEVEKDYYNDLIAKANTLNAYCNIKCKCPKCKKYFIISGYVCFGCGHDITASK